MQELIKQVQESCAAMCESHVVEIGRERKLGPFHAESGGIHDGITYAAAIRALDLSHMSKASNTESITMDELSEKLAEFIAIKSPDKDEWYGLENEIYRDCINEFLDFISRTPTP